ncbi:MarR family transcriptional regulator [Geodermatophilus sp. DSM 44513]|uniref:MarR family winged helix-turn-helix transcriptional regulator n=1 Tax=Geodermatophilus sp. DSM 44513 TaxID=1528104 RepID=UPI0012766A28|nr:MarR family transcriptional regulator [Geodermatophilus sp. DSM 44513]WNV75552.1 MarR family transcriptional regulator [Geodermatophilus sp. DSM 44513]
MSTVDDSRVRATAAQRSDLGEAVMRFFEAFARTLHAAAEAGGLTVPQARLIDVLQPGQPLPMTEVARLLGCDTSNATGLVDRLEQRGLLERRAAPADRRVRAVVLTPAGESARADLVQRTRTDNPLFARLDGEAARRLSRQLQALARPDDPAGEHPDR